MIIVRTMIDGKGPYNFIIDSGVGVIIVTDPNLVDSIGHKTSRRIKLSGIGDGKDLEATVRSGISFDIGGVTGFNLSAAILNKDQFGLSNYAGMAIHGLIGYDFFSNLAVRFNFTDSTMLVASPGYFKDFRKGIHIPLIIEQNKPYIKTGVILDGSKTDSAKLLIDLGAGHPLLLENTFHTPGYPGKSIHANLGVGLTGPVTGLLSRVKELDLGKYKFNGVITSIPQSDSLVKREALVFRDGSIGLGLLKRFTFVLDYQNGIMYLKPSVFLRIPFEHDMSGLEYYADGPDYHVIIVSRVEPGSPADELGIKRDDAIIAINFKSVGEMTIQDIDNIFKSGEDRSLLIDILRDKKRYRMILTLKRRI